MKKLIWLLILIMLLGGVLFFWNDISDYSAKLFFKLPEVEKQITSLVQEAEKKITTPEPFRASEEATRSFLNQKVIIEQTNIQREFYGLPSLQENLKLNNAALLKAQDMISNQYFEHVSPLGEGVGDLAERVGYQFIAIGENLALGNFKDDKALIQGWMDSPGHRANILSSQYQEIGVAVLQGEFEGRTTWLAVQHFGLPLTACPQPSEELEAKITENQQQIESLQGILSALKQEIEDMKPRRGQAYSQKIEQYNALISQYNALLSMTQELISQYNSQVVLFNECAAG